MYILGNDEGGNMLYSKIVSTESFMNLTWRPDTVWQYCKECERYDVHFSCPEHAFNISTYVYAYPIVWIFMSHIMDHKSFGNSITQRFFHYRDLIDPQLMYMESQIPGSKAILPGQCRNCSNSCDTDLTPECRYPELLRYSFESLGFDVNAILETNFYKKLTFKSGEHILVYGLFLSEEPSTDVRESMVRRLQDLETE